MSRRRWPRSWDRGSPVLDMGSGSGVLCSAIVERWPGTHLTAVDVRHQESTVGADRFVQGDVLTLDWDVKVFRHHFESSV